ncbi:peptidase M28 [Yeosuana aromativorans]|uniref:Carboxypeptidase Q n=1 Tax=Yeosuana aromativorans TaxID=288019 RepID=A0A8J3BJU3_9FLAO|nr:M20/M25/M40 family metallo-hydrolase [Yeosuana aromativorans]GGK24690.1 peptidase M28 [Yeosuana aromativorans]
MHIHKLFILIVLLAFSNTVSSQTDETVIKDIYHTSLTNGKSYEWLEYLTKQIGSRLSGSLGAERAVTWTKEELDKLGLDRVWLQPVMVPKWVRGAKEYAYIESAAGKTTSVNICALGGSVPTPALGVKANIVEVHDFEQLAALGTAGIEGKIVFYNRPMQTDLINPFDAYGKAGDQRRQGAFEASKYGAVGVIVRSLNSRLDDLPHTGNMSYRDLPESKRIPAAAISTNDAELLSTMLKLDDNIKFYFKQNCKQFNDVQSYNVIGQITGSQFPDEYMVVGGHLDSWDLGDGAHDDGVGVVQSMDVLRLFKELGIKPKRTIRVVLFMNEENGSRGGTKYAEEAKRNNENHIFALESDSGGFTPRGFSFDCNDAQFGNIAQWEPLFKPYLIHYFEKGESGADVGHLKNGTTVLAGLFPDPQRYFDYHHASNDTFDAIDKRELELGTATMASLLYLVDKYGIK